MYRYCFGAILLILLPVNHVVADDSQPIDAVNTFFEAMAGNNAELAATVMIWDGQLYGYVESAEGLRLVRTSADQFIEGMANRHDSLLERIWDVKVLQDGRLAVAWTPYDFFLNREFHHCGTNIFSLIRTDDGWKIAGATYSMETETCEDSPLGPPTFDE